MTESHAVAPESERLRAHRLLAQALAESAGCGAVLVCRPIMGTSSAVLSDVAVVGSSDGAAAALLDGAATNPVPQDSFQAASLAMTRGFVEVPRDPSDMAMRRLGDRAGYELSWLVCDPDTRAVLAWVVFAQPAEEGPPPRGLRNRLSRTRAHVSKALHKLPPTSASAAKRRGFVMFDVSAGVVDASPGLSGWAATPGVAARLVTLAADMAGGFEASIAGATIRCEALSRRADLQIGWVQEDRPLYLAPKSLLTPTQRRVAEYAIEGATCAEISRTLEASVETVRSHMKEIYRRLGVCCRAELTQLMAWG